MGDGPDDRKAILLTFFTAPPVIALDLAALYAAFFAPEGSVQGTSGPFGGRIVFGLLGVVFAPFAILFGFALVVQTIRLIVSCFRWVGRGVFGSGER